MVKNHIVAEIVSGEEFDSVTKAAKAALRKDAINISFDHKRSRRDGCIGVNVDIDGNAGTQSIEMRLPLPIIGLMPAAEKVISEAIKQVVVSFIAQGRFLDSINTQEVMFAVIKALKRSPVSSVRVKEIVPVPSLQDVDGKETIVAFESMGKSKGTRFIYNPLTNLWSRLSPKQYGVASSRPNIKVTEIANGIKVVFNQNETLSFTLPIRGLSSTEVKQILFDIYKDKTLVVLDTESMVNYLYRLINRLGDENYVSSVFPVDTASVNFRHKADGQMYTVNNEGIVSVADENTALLPDGFQSLKHLFSFSRRLRFVSLSSLQENLKYILLRLRGKKTDEGSSQKKNYYVPKGQQGFKLGLILMALVVFLSACANPTSASENKPTPDTDGVKPTATDEATQETHEPADPGELETNVTPSPTDFAIELSIPEPYNSDMLWSEGGFYRVEVPEDFNQNHPPMVSYVFSDINYKHDMGVESIVIEFNLKDAPDSMDSDLFGYNRAFFVGLYNLDTIPVMPFYVQANHTIDPSISDFSDIDKEMMLLYPEMGVDMSSYVERDGDRFTIRIPYDQFAGGAKNLILQFLPGVTFGNLNVYAVPNGSVNVGSIEESLTQEQESSPEYDLNDIYQQWWGAEAYDREATRAEYIEMVDCQEWLIDAMVEFAVNPDGSINMPVSEYDLEGIDGEYAVVPDGLFSFITSLGQDFYPRQQGQAAVDFILNNMVDEETGLIHGVWDIEKGELVDTDRPVANLPIIFALYDLRDYNVIDKDVLDNMMQAAFEHEVVTVNGTFYYAPRGYDETTGVMNMELADLAVNEAFFREFTGLTTTNPEMWPALLMEAYANSLQLVHEAQETNPTNLPADGLQIIFHDDGAYELNPVGQFSADNHFFALGPIAYESGANNYFYRSSEKMGPEFEQYIADLSGENGPLDNEDVTARLTAEASIIAINFRNSYRILNLLYQSYYDVYNFAKIQGIDTVYAPAYDVQSGEMISPEALPNDGSALRGRFGSPASSANWFQLVGFFHDEEMAKDAAVLTVVNLHMFSTFVMDNQSVSDLDQAFFTNNGLDITEFDTLRTFVGYKWSSAAPNYILFDNAEEMGWRIDILSQDIYPSEEFDYPINKFIAIKLKQKSEQRDEADEDLNVPYSSSLMETSTNQVIEIDLTYRNLLLDHNSIIS